MTVQLSIYHHLQQLLNKNKSYLADAVGLSIPATQIVMTQCLGIVTIALVRYYQQHGSQDTYQTLLHNSQVHNIKRHTTYDNQTIYLARDSGRPVLDKLLQSPERWATIANQMSQHHSIKPQAAIDLLQIVAALTLREVGSIAEQAMLEPDELDRWLEIQAHYFERPLDHVQLNGTDIPEVIALADDSSENLPLTPTLRRINQVMQQHANGDVKALVKQPKPAKKAMQSQTNTQSDNKSKFLLPVILAAIFSIGMMAVLFTDLKGMILPNDRHVIENDPTEFERNPNGTIKGAVSQDIAILSVDKERDEPIPKLKPQSTSNEQ